MNECKIYKRGFWLMAICLITIVIMSCTQNQRAKQWGGTAYYSIPADKEFVFATWKESDLWIVTKPREVGHEPKVYTMTEESSWGVLQGGVIITEE